MAETLRRLVRFGLVGVANTAVYYLCYRLFLLLLPYLAAHLIAWALSVVFSFFLNCWFTYRVRPTWRRFLGFPLSTLVNLTFTTLGSVLLVEAVSFDERYATLLMGILAIPFTFAVTTVVLTTGVNDPRREQGGVR
ncbi:MULTISPECIES: GtrA family protein [unclassified Luteococcus]|uniref:GtrA family protein n=1 Tax=unclassified Luteococcus TaxID=2639923 RepID=UPI00313E8C98